MVCNCEGADMLKCFVAFVKSWNSDKYFCIVWYEDKTK